MQDIVRLHGGTLEVTSEEGRGSSFRVKLRSGCAHLPPNQLASNPQPPASESRAPAECVTAWLPPAGDAALPDAPSTPTVRERVLWVEDNADLRDYVHRLLAEHYDVRAVETGARALQIARAEHPDLILSDIMLPELDGLGLLRELRSAPSTRHVPVILLSARAGREAAIDGLDAGADDYLIKPFTARELLARVRSHLSLSRARRARPIPTASIWSSPTTTCRTCPASSSPSNSRACAPASRSR